MAGLSKEVWLADIEEDFYGNDSFMSECRDMSALVDNDKINLAEAGVIPSVLKNNNIYPVPTAERPDTALEYVLDYYDTENTVVRNAELAELSYDKRASIIYGHKQSLKMDTMQRAAYAWAPSGDTTETPVIGASGGDDGTGVHKISFEDILKLRAKFNDGEVPMEGRIMILNPLHETQLMSEDIKLFKSIFDGNQQFASFKFYTLASKRLPLFAKAGGAKQTFGQAASGLTTHGSFAYQKDEVMKADGTLDMFDDLKNPRERGDVLGFQKRFIAASIRNRGAGAIFSPAV